MFIFADQRLQDAELKYIYKSSSPPTRLVPSPFQITSHDIGINSFKTFKCSTAPDPSPKNYALNKKPKRNQNVYHTLHVIPHFKLPIRKVSD